ncbi:PorP/SprF family type IX secretion system membrane protein [Natronoflexus pectinivorans]|uniref:Type IX secretion system PorP/SprF family membrane protein n=1 Tax=Natronoflexus pectinivorans TaxID=682526 RepID=A0A4R2GKJ0_9BACT|nr:type IX secretion system membrane protein PorP/SprF [Natronoflexus pectinivorans]TCO09344.1 type IX secretion system PorP/SprF family membrane protein [Natronoflexus pectinivorans]
MIKKYLILIGLVLTVGGGMIIGQNQYQFNHYIANQGLLNPAYNGTRDIISGLMIHRSQWVGLEGAPMNQALNIHGPIEDTDVGLGLSIVNDRIGFTNTLDLFGAASYKLRLDYDEKFLSFGLQFGLSSMVYDGTDAVIIDYEDPLFSGKETKLNFNFGFGAYYFSDDYFIGFSIPKFFTDQFDERSEGFKNSIDYKNIHKYLYGGYVFDWHPVKVKPTLMIREVYGAPLVFDFSTSVLLADQVWVGLAYRSISDMVFLLEYIINRQFTVRYSADYPFNSMNRHAKFGSHEISLQFDFSFNRRPGMRSIRYF